MCVIINVVIKVDEYDHINDYINSRVNDDEARMLVSDFAILWNQYERTLYEKGHHIGAIWSKINKYKNQILSIQKLNDLYNRFSDYLKFRNIPFNYDGIEDAYKFNVKKEKPDDRIDIEKWKLEEAINEKDPIHKAYLLLLISAKVRNNMFHGTKGPWELSEQKELFKICNEMLMAVLEATNFKDE